MKRYTIYSGVCLKAWLKRRSSYLQKAGAYIGGIELHSI